MDNIDEVIVVDDEEDNDALIEDQDEEEVDEPTLTFEVKNGRIRRKIDDYPAMVQAVDKILRTERFVWAIYDDQYGHDLETLIGKDMEYAKTEVDRMIKEALYDDDRVIDVKITEIKQISADSLSVSGVCSTVYGDISIETEVETRDTK